MGTAQLRNMWGLMMSERVDGRVWIGMHSMTGSKENVPLNKLTLPFPGCHRRLRSYGSNEHFQLCHLGEQQGMREVPQTRPLLSAAAAELSPPTGKFLKTTFHTSRFWVPSSSPPNRNEWIYMGQDFHRKP